MNKSKHWDLGVTVISQVLMVASSLIMLPFAVTKLSGSELAVWYIYLNVQGLVLLLDFGMTDTFIRFFSYAYAGARNIKSSEIPSKNECGSVNYQLLVSLMRTAKKAYLCISLLAGIAMLTAGSYYLQVMTKEASLEEAIWPSWILFTFTMMIQSYYQWQSLPLIASGKVRRNYAIAVRSRLMQVSTSVIVLILSPSIFLLCAAFAFSVLIMRVEYYLALKPLRENTRHIEPAHLKFSHISQTLLENTKKQGSSIIGVLMVNRLIALSVGWFAGLSVSGQYSIVNQALISINSVAFVLQTMLTSKIADAVVKNDREMLRGYYSASLVFGWTVYIVGTLLFIVLVPNLLNMIGSNTSLPSNYIIIFMASIFVLEMTMFTSTRTVTMIENRVTWWKSMVVTGFAVVIAVISAGHSGLGLIGILWAQVIPQALYNYWRWPTYCLKQLRMTALSVFSYAASLLRNSFRTV